MVSDLLEPVGTSPTDTVDVLCSIFLQDKTFCLVGKLMKTESVLRGGGETFGPAGELLKLQKKTVQRLQEVPETAQVQETPPSPSMHKQEGSLRNSLRPNEPPGRGLDQLRTPQPTELPADCALCFRLPDFVNYHPIWGDAAVPVSNPNKAHWVTELDFGGILTLVCHHIPIWEEETFICISSGIVSGNREPSGNLQSSVCRRSS